jgi:nitrate reductase gamma subunit
MLDTVLFGVYPYVAFFLCVVISCVRFDTSQYSWKADSSQLLSGKNMRVASNLFHIGVIFVLCGHFVGLLLPESIYHHVISTPNKQILAMVSGGFFGLLCLVGLVMLIQRRMTNDRVRANSKTSDIVVLWLLLGQLMLGLISIVISADHLDGSVMVLLANWAQAIVTFNPTVAVENIATVHWVYKAHIFLGTSLLLVFPFTRLVHIISVPVWYFGRKYQVVRQKM